MLKERVITALALAVVLVGALYFLPPVATVVLITLAVLAGAWEWSAFLGRTGLAARIAYGIFIAALLAVAWYATRDPGAELLLLHVAVGWWIVAFLWITFAPGHVNPLTAALAGVLVLVPSWVAMVHLRTELPNGADWILFLLVLVAAADTGAFFAGRWFGRVKLAPRVSPGKTWEGVIGGMLASGTVAVLCSRWMGREALPFFVLCMAAVAFSVIGDLTESLFKRAAGLKDSGGLLRGHGGVLDRIDSLTAAAPVILAGLYAQGPVP